MNETALTTDHPSSKRFVHSFDIFDTIVARNVASPTDVFDRVEQAGVHNFKSIRIRAQELSNHTWQDIYRNYQILTGCDTQEAQRIQELELRAESEVVYLINANYLAVQEGDILVSDMYLPASAIRRLLEKVGFKKQVSLHISPSGKASGNIWAELKARYYIAQHTGDNLQSDVYGPKAHGIRTIHSDVAALSKMERKLSDLGARNCAAVVRQFRLSNPHVPGSRAWRMHDLQASCNLPVLLFLISQLRHIMDDEKLSRLLFTTRDGCLLHRVFKKLYPEIHSVELHSSRVAFIEARTAYREYLRKMYAPGSSLIFDMHGAFRSGRNIFREIFGILPRVHICSLAEGRAEGVDSISWNYIGNDAIERLNFDIVGPLVSVQDDSSVIRAPMPVLEFEIAGYYRESAVRMTTLIENKIELLREEIKSLYLGVRWDEIGHHVEAAVINDPDLSSMRQEDHRSLTMLANDLATDKGTSFKCAHGYSYIYELILNRFSQRQHFDLLEIGLNRDASNSIPSLTMWQQYFGSRVELFGMDINPMFASHNQHGITIIIGDASAPDDLKRCAAASPNGFDIIIDDGFHATKHQQITLSNLWGALKPNGLFIIEDLHFQPEVDSAITTKALLLEWSKGNAVSTPYISELDTNRILREVTSIQFFDSRSKSWPSESLQNAFVVIRKRDNFA